MIPDGQLTTLFYYVVVAVRICYTTTTYGQALGSTVVAVGPGIRMAYLYQRLNKAEVVQKYYTL